MLNNFYPIRIVAPQLHYFGRVFYFMAKDKKSFLLYCDIIHTVEQLTDEQAGSLFKHILQYVNDKKPCSESIITKIAFEPIKQSLKRDLDRYDSICKRNSDNAKKRWDATASDRIPNDTKNADSDSDSDSDILLMDIRKQKFKTQLEPYVDIHGSDCLNDFYHYWAEHGEKDKKMRFEKEKTFGISARLRTWMRIGGDRYNNKISPEEKKAMDKGFINKNL